MLNLIIHGHTGRLAKKVLDNLNKYPNILYIGYIDRSYNMSMFKGINNLIILDISSDDGCKNLLTYLIKEKIYIPLIVGSTGSLPKDLIKEYSDYTIVKEVSNFSEGITKISQIIKSLILNNSSINIEETHHIMKKDTPSGTAKTLANIIGINNDNIKSIREGTQYGLHTIVISNEYEKITLTHETLDPNIFAIGCLNLIETIYL